MPLCSKIDKHFATNFKKHAPFKQITTCMRSAIEVNLLHKAQIGTVSNAYIQNSRHSEHTCGKRQRWKKPCFCFDFSINQNWNTLFNHLHVFLLAHLIHGFLAHSTVFCYFWKALFTFWDLRNSHHNFLQSYHKYDYKYHIKTIKCCWNGQQFTSRTDSARQVLAFCFEMNLMLFGMTIFLGFF